QLLECLQFGDVWPPVSTTLADRLVAFIPYAPKDASEAQAHSLLITDLLRVLGRGAAACPLLAQAILQPAQDVFDLDYPYFLRLEAETRLRRAGVRVPTALDLTSSFQAFDAFPLLSVAVRLCCADAALQADQHDKAQALLEEVETSLKDVSRLTI